MTEPGSRDEQIERLEARLGALETSRTGLPLNSSMERLIKFLPLFFLSNLLVGVPAVLISLALAYTSFVQAEATQKIQQGEAWPFLSYGTSNATIEGEKEISLTLANNGVGPALLGPIEIRYRGSAVGTAEELLQRCCDYREGASIEFATSPSTGISIRPGESVDFFRLPATPANAEIWRVLNEERWKLDVRSCYCSLFNECWVIEGSQSKPRSVDQCPAGWVPYTGL